MHSSGCFLVHSVPICIGTLFFYGESLTFSRAYCNCGEYPVRPAAGMNPQREDGSADQNSATTKCAPLPRLQMPMPIPSARPIPRRGLPRGTAPARTYRFGTGGCYATVGVCFGRVPRLPEGLAAGAYIIPQITKHSHPSLVQRNMSMK